MPVHLGSAAINAAYLGASAVDKIYLGANAVYTAIAPPAQVTGLAVDATGDGTIDLSWSAPASDAAITDYSVEYTDAQPLTGVALLAPFDSDLDDVLGITGTATNTPTITSGGKFGSYADLGAADKLTYSSVSFGSGDYTVEGWVKRTESSWSPNSGNPLLELPGVAMIGRAGTDTLQLYEDDFGSWAAVPGTTTSSINQDWHHVALVRDGSTLRFYLDGAQVGTMSTSANPSSLVFGASTIYGCRFGLDDLRVSTSAVYPSGTTFTPPTTAHPTSGGGTTATVLVGSATTSYQLTGLTNGTQYSVRVAAVSAAGTGAYSAAVTGTPSAVLAGSLYSFGTRYGTQQLGSDADWSLLGGGENWSLAIKSNGTLWAWGNGGFGKLGNGSTADQAFAVQVGSGSWSRVSSGALHHSLGILADGTLWSWGQGANGRLGLGSTTNYSTPQLVSSDSWSYVAAGYNSSFGIKADGTLWVWGYGAQGQLGLGSTSSPTTPQQVGSDAWIRVAGGEAHTLAIKADGTLWATGYNNEGRLGLGDVTNRTSFTQVGADNTWAYVECGKDCSYGIKANGTLWAWGKNSWGQLGIGNKTDQTTPQQVGSESWLAVSGWNLVAAGVKSDGTLHQWGLDLPTSPSQIGAVNTYFDVRTGDGYIIALYT